MLTMVSNIVDLIIVQYPWVYHEIGDTASEKLSKELYLFICHLNLNAYQYHSHGKRFSALHWTIFGGVCVTVELLRSLIIIYIYQMIVIGIYIWSHDYQK